MTTKAKLQALLELESKATPGPWRIHATSEYVIESKDKTVGMLGGIDNLVNNGKMICESRNQFKGIVTALKIAYEALENMKFDAREDHINKAHYDNFMLKIEARSQIDKILGASE